MIDPFKFLLHCNRLALRKPDQAKLLSELLSEDTDSLAPLAVEVAIAEGDPIGQVLRSVLHEAPNLRVCVAIEALVPKDTVALRELALEILQQKLGAFATLFDLADEQYIAIQEALVGVTRISLPSDFVIADLSPQFSSEEYGGSPDDSDLYQWCCDCLRNAGECLRNLGNLSEGIVLLRRAERVACGLFEFDADRYRRCYSLVLNALASLLLDYGHVDEALEYVKQSGRINTATEQCISNECQESVAEAGYLLSKILSQTNELPDAIHFAECALKDFARFCESKPTGLERWMTLVSANYITILRKGGFLTKSALYAHELLDVLKNLVTCSADAFLPDYANALVNLSESLMISGRLTDSIDAAADSVRYNRQLHSLRPQVFATSLCSALTQLTAASAIANGAEAAFPYLNEAIEIAQGMARNLPEAKYREGCALLHRAHLWLQLKEWQKAYDDAVAASNDFSACERDYSLSDPKMAAHALLVRIESLIPQEKYGDALKLVDDLATMNAALKWHYPDEHGLHLARSFEVMAIIRIGLRQYDDAYGLAWTALTRFEVWVGERSLFFDGQHASVLKTFSLAALLKGDRDLWNQYHDQAQNLYAGFEAKGLHMYPPPPMLTQAR